MPSVPRTVARSTRLLIRLGLCRRDALRTIMLVTSHGIARWEPTGMDVQWMRNVYFEAKRQLERAPCSCQPTGEGDNANARTAKPGADSGR